MAYLSRFVVLFFGVMICGTLADHSQDDCQDNEVFVKCGRCEGTCSFNPGSCKADCNFPRCECPLNIGFVRAPDGTCIKSTECRSYGGATTFVEGRKGVYKTSEGRLPPVLRGNNVALPQDLTPQGGEQGPIFDSDDAEAIKAGAMGYVSSEESEAFEEMIRKNKGKTGVHSPDFYGFLVRRHRHRNL